MYFDLNDEQREIQSTAKDFLASRFKSERIRELAETDLGFDEADWTEISGLGWPGLALPEELGGQGLGIVDLAVLFEQLGYALAPTPLLSNTIAALAVTAGGSDEQKEEFVRPAAAGERRGTPALYDAGTRGEPGDITMEGGDGEVVLDGVKLYVQDASSADWLLVATADGRRHIVDRDAEGVTVTPTPSIDITRRLYAVSFDGVQVPDGRTLPASGEDFLPVRDRAFVTVAAELVGVAQRTLDMAVEYAKERQQFGRPIGAYQAVSHRCAEMLLNTENARSTTYYAAWTADAEPETLPVAAAMAKASASDAGFRVAADSLQVHGGIGFTWEHDLHLWLKRARADAAMWGDANWHRARVAELVLDAAPVAAATPA